MLDDKTPNEENVSLDEEVKDESVLEGAGEQAENGGQVEEGRQTEGGEEGEKDRTKEQFEKLLESNKALKEENERLKQAGGADLFLNTPGSYQPVTPQSLPTSQLGQLYNIPKEQVEDIAQSIFDEEGYVKKDELEKRLIEARTEAENARMQTLALQQELLRNREEIRRIEESAQTREAYKEFPELNPNDERFDSEFRELVREKMLLQALNGEKDLVKACRDVKQLQEKMAKRATSVNQNEVKKEINATSGTRRDTKATSQEYERLMEAARRGKKGSVAALLRMRGS